MLTINYSLTLYTMNEKKREHSPASPYDESTKNCPSPLSSITAIYLLYHWDAGSKDPIIIDPITSLIFRVS